MADATTTERLRSRLSGRFPAGLRSVEPFEGTLGMVRFDAPLALDLFRELRDVHHFTHLAMVAGIDWEKEREVLYTLWSDEVRQYLLLSTRLPAEHPHVESATAIWPAADWHEREAWELVDITFDHHPGRPVSLLMPAA